MAIPTPVITQFCKYRTHRHIDPDAAFEALVALHFGEPLFPGISQYLERNPKEWLEFVDEAEVPDYLACRASGIICGDYGLDPDFDDHVSNKQGGCSTMLMARKCGLDETHFLWDLIEAINRHDIGHEKGRFGLFGGRVQVVRPYIDGDDYRLFRWFRGIFNAELCWHTRNPLQDFRPSCAPSTFDQLVAHWLVQSDIAPLKQARATANGQELKARFDESWTGEKARAVATTLGMEKWQPIQSLLGYVERVCATPLHEVNPYTLAGFLPRLEHCYGKDKTIAWLNQMLTAEVKLQQNFFGAARETFVDQVIKNRQYHFYHCPIVGRRIAVVWLVTNNDLAISYARSHFAWRETRDALNMPFTPAVLIQQSHIDPTNPQLGCHIRLAINQKHYADLDLAAVARVIRVWEMEKRAGTVLPLDDWLSYETLSSPGKIAQAPQWYMCSSSDALEELPEVELEDDPGSSATVANGTTWAILNGGRKAQAVEPTALTLQEVINACRLGLSGALPIEEVCTRKHEHICAGCAWARYHLPQCYAMKPDPELTATYQGLVEMLQQACAE